MAQSGGLDSGPASRDGNLPHLPGTVRASLPLGHGFPLVESAAQALRPAWWTEVSGLAGG